MTVAPGFTEEWYPPQQLALVCDLAQSTAGILGSCLEVGAWQGRSTVTIAQAIHPSILHVVDHFRGQVDTPTTQAVAQQRDIYAEYCANIRAFTRGNVRTHRLDFREYWETGRCPLSLRFVHLDDGHGYDEIAPQIRVLWPRLVPGGVLCGDDYAAYPDVHRAVCELLPGHQANGNLWFIRKAEA